jgi:hypothetical protein
VTSTRDDQDDAPDSLKSWSRAKSARRTAGRCAHHHGGERKRAGVVIDRGSNQAERPGGGFGLPEICSRPSDCESRARRTVALCPRRSSLQKVQIPSKRTQQPACVGNHCNLTQRYVSMCCPERLPRDMRHEGPCKSAPTSISSIVEIVHFDNHGNRAPVARGRPLLYALDGGIASQDVAVVVVASLIHLRTDALG